MPGKVSQTLRRSQPADGVNTLPFPQIEYFHAVVAEGGDEQSFVRSVEIQVVDASFHPRQRDRLLQLKSPALRFSGGEMIAEERDDDDER